MPVEPIVIDTSIVAVGESVELYGNILLVGENEGGTLAINTVKEYTNLADIATDFLISSKVYKAAVMIFNQGVKKLRAVKVAVTAVVGESITAGSAVAFAQSPVKGGTVVIATYTVQYAWTDPPTDPGALKAEVGTSSSKIFINGAGSKSVNYSYYDTVALVNVIKDYEDDIDIIYFCSWTDGAGNGGVSPQDWGITHKIVDWCDTYNWVTILPGRGDELKATQQTDLTQTTFSSKNVMTLAHLDVSTDDDVGAAMVGKMAAVVPWDKMMWKGIKEMDEEEISEFAKSDVTALETAKVNALFFRSGLPRTSDGLTSVGGDYKYIDITRTQYYIEKLIKTVLSDLIQNEIVSYTPAGISQVKSVIQSACEQAVLEGALRVPWTDDADVFQRGYAVEVPDFNDVPAADREDRILKNVFITIWLRGHIQSINMNMEIQL